MNFRTHLPILDWLPRYSIPQLKGDLSAGLTVGVMLIPQGMAYSMLAGLPAIYGLYASTLPLIIYAVFGTSRQLAVGPVAMVSLLTASGVGVLAEGGTEAYLTYAVVLALMVGAIQFALGAFRLLDRGDMNARSGLSPVFDRIADEVPKYLGDPGRIDVRHRQRVGRDDCTRLGYGRLQFSQS